MCFSYLWDMPSSGFPTGNQVGDREAPFLPHSLFANSSCHLNEELHYDNLLRICDFSPLHPLNRNWLGPRFVCSDSHPIKRGSAKK